MTEAIEIIAAASGGVAIGGVIGWPLGVRMRGRPVTWISAMAIALAGSCFASFQALAEGRLLVADLWLGIGFGAMSGIKYAGGIALFFRERPAEEPKD